jgi:short-subunit dehydrogenase
MVSLITGASGGIGEAIARELAKRKFDVALVARSADKLERLAADVRREYGVKAHVIAADLAAPGAAADVLARTRAEAGRLDILVNNAGFGVLGPFLESDLEPQREMIRLNVEVLTELTRRALPDLVAVRGRILNVASTAAFQPGPLMAVYYATKAYVLSFSEALAVELAPSGVVVTALCPGPTLTGFRGRAGMDKSRLFALRRPMSAEAVARRGVEALFKGRRVVIPGFLNWLVAQSVRLAPRRLPPKIAQWLNG